MREGIFRLDFEAYTALKAVNRSTLAFMGVTPAHAKAHMETPLKKPTKALKQGIALHSIALEGNRDHGIKLTDLEAETVEGMIRAVAENRQFQEIIKGSQVELSIVWQDKATGVWCKARPDMVRSDTHTIYDLKSCASIPRFSGDVWAYRYHLQAAFYLMGAKAVGMDMRHFKFLAVENKPIYGTRAYSLSPGAIDLGMFQLQNLLKLYAACEANDHWPGYSSDEEEIAVPATEIQNFIGMEETHGA